MKKLSIFLALLIMANCSGLHDLRPPHIKGSINKTVALYINPEMLTKHQVGATKNVVSADLGGVKKDQGAWKQNVGELSAKQFEDALQKAFSRVEVVKNKKAGGASYLVVPTIIKSQLVIRTLLQSYIDLTYRLEIYDQSNKLVYSDEETITRKGKYKKATGMGIGGIPIPVTGKISAQEDESEMIFEAVCDGVDKIVNKMIASGKL